MAELGHLSHDGVKTSQSSYGKVGARHSSHNKARVGGGGGCTPLVMSGPPGSGPREGRSRASPPDTGTVASYCSSGS